VGLILCFFKFASTTSFISDTTALSGLGRNVTVLDYVAPDKNPVTSLILQNETITSYSFVQGTYQNMYPVSFVHVWQGEGTDYFTDDTTPATSIVMAGTAAWGNTTTINRSFCDEFQLSFFIACPPLFVLNVAVPP